MTYQVILFTDLTGQFYHNKALGAYSLASTLRSNGFSVLVVDHFSRLLDDLPKLNQVLKRAIGPNTLFVGLSGTFFTDALPETKPMQSWNDFNGGDPTPIPCVEKTSIIFKLIKKFNPNTKIVYGGMQSKALNTADIDFVVDGYGESATLHLCNHLLHNTPIKTFTRNNLTVLDYDTLASDYLFKNHSTVYCADDILLPNETLALETSRGCMFNCNFCDFPLRNRKRDNFDYHTDDSLLREYFIRNYELSGIVNYMITDDTFNETTEKLKRFRDVVKSTNLPLQFMCFIRIDLLHKHPEQLEILLDAGIISIWIGLESLYQASSNSVNKNYRSEIAKQTILDIRAKAGEDFKIYASFIFGLPEDTPETIEQWMKWVIEDSTIDCIQVEPLYINDKTPWPAEFALNPERYGYTTTVNWHNKIWNFDEANALAEYYKKLLWNSGRNRLAAFHLFGLMSYGYKFDDIKNLSLKDLPFDEIKSRGVEQYNDYVSRLINHLSK